MILGVFVFNAHGKARLVRWYDPRLRNLPFDRKRRIVWECYRCVAHRAAGACNFLVKARGIFGEQLITPLARAETKQIQNLCQSEKRDQKDGPDVVTENIESRDNHPVKRLYGRDLTVVFRHYATLFFVFAVDQNENELGILDLIQVFVETLDKYFGNVCELDIVFNHDKVNHLLDELVSGGVVLETNQTDILSAVYTVSEATSAEASTHRFPSLGIRPYR